MTVYFATKMFAEPSRLVPAVVDMPRPRFSEDSMRAIFPAYRLTPNSHGVCCRRELLGSIQYRGHRVAAKPQSLIGAHQ